MLQLRGCACRFTRAWRLKAGAMVSSVKDASRSLGRASNPAPPRRCDFEGPDPPSAGVGPDRRALRGVVFGVTLQGFRGDPVDVSVWFDHLLKRLREVLCGLDDIVSLVLSRVTVGLSSPNCLVLVHVPSHHRKAIAHMSPALSDCSQRVDSWRFAKPERI